MTREEAIRELKIQFVGEYDRQREAKDVAIKALEQELCNDAISRQAVNILVDELARAISDERCCISRGRSTATIMQDILDLPSVKPQEPKTGHWKRIGYDIYECSICGQNVMTGDICAYRHCHGCGAKMESEES